MLDVSEIQAIIPHRDPFLLIDRIDELEAGVRAVGAKHVAEDEPYFAGHFPGHPVMPGVLIIEALAQVGAVALLAAPENHGRIAFFAGIDKVRFKRQVKPGDTLHLEVRITRSRATVGFGEATARVDGEIVCSGELMFAIQ